jgi:hypothetical protein
MIVSSSPPERVEPPFAGLPPRCCAALAAQIGLEALRANDRYLHAFVEEYSFCPFARGGREAGQTQRYVHYADAASPERLVESLVELMLRIAADETQVVAQVILPLIEVEPEAWIHFCDELTALGHARRGGPAVLAFAALHPRLAYSDQNAFAMVPLFRRSPDPTIQWVRLDGLEKIYEGRDSEVRFVDPAHILEFLRDAPPPRPPLYDRIAETNRKMARRLGLPRVEAMLAGYAADAQRAYQRVLLEHACAAHASPASRASPEMPEMPEMRTSPASPEAKEPR